MTTNALGILFRQGFNTYPGISVRELGGKGEGKRPGQWPRTHRLQSPSHRRPPYRCRQHKIKNGFHG